VGATSGLIGRINCWISPHGRTAARIDEAEMLVMLDPLPELLDVV